MGKKRVFVSTLILTGSAIVARVLSMYYRVVLSQHIGAEGMGLFELIFSVYLLVVTVAYSGVNIAVTRLAAEGKSGAGLLRAALKIVAPIGLVTGIGLFAFSGGIARGFLGDARAAQALLALAPSVPFMSVSACLNAYFIGTDKVIKSATGQVLEHTLRIIVILVAIKRAEQFGVGGVCAAAAFGMTAGEVFACIYAVILYLAEGVNLKKGDKTAAKEVLAISVPIAVGNYASAAMGTAENLLLPKELALFEGSAALATYGMLQGMALPLMMFPSTLISSLSAVIMPRIAALRKSGENGALATDVIGFSAVCSVFIVGVFVTFPYQLSAAVYGGTQVGGILSMLAYICPFMYIESVISSMLVGLDGQTSVLVVNLCESAVRLFVICRLIEKFGIAAFIAVTVAGSVVTTAVKYFMLVRKTGLRTDFAGWVLRPAICTVASGALARVFCGVVLWRNLPVTPALVIGIALMLVLFLIFMEYTKPRFNALCVK